MGVITISRQLGSGAADIVAQVAEQLRYDVVDKQIISEVARATGVPEERVSDVDEQDETGLRGILGRWFEAAAATGAYRASGFGDAAIPPGALMDELGETMHVLDREVYHEVVRQAIRKLAERGDVLIVGRGGMMVLQDVPGVLRVRVTASEQSRAERVGALEGLGAREALQLVRDSDRRRSAFISRNYHADWDDASLYHLVINTEIVPASTGSRVVVAAAEDLAKPQAGAARIRKRWFRR